MQTKRFALFVVFWGLISLYFGAVSGKTVGCQLRALSDNLVYEFLMDGTVVKTFEDVGINACALNETTARVLECEIFDGLQGWSSLSKYVEEVQWTRTLVFTLTGTTATITDELTGLLTDLGSEHFHEASQDGAQWVFVASKRDGAYQERAGFSIDVEFEMQLDPFPDVLDGPWMRLVHSHFTNYCLVFTSGKVLLKKICSYEPDSPSHVRMLKLDRFGHLVGRTSLRCVDAEGAYDGAAVIMSKCHSLQPGVWQPRYIGTQHSSSGAVAKVIHKESGLCLAPTPNNSNAEPMTLILQNCSTVDDSLLHWRINDSRIEGFRDMGCYREQDAPAVSEMSVVIEQNTTSTLMVTDCVQMCKNYMFAGLVKGTTGDQETCRCGMTFGRYGLLSDSVCDSSALFAQSIVMKKPLCDAPERPLYTTLVGAHLSSGEYIYYNTIEYICQQGYEWTAGNLIRTCRASGDWDGEEPVCSAVQCEEPPLPEKGTYSPGTTTRNFTYLTVLSYDCQEFTKPISGDSERKCLHDKMWSGERLVCEDCKHSRSGHAYAGQLSQTANGQTCQRWDSHYPHVHDMIKWNFPERSFTAAENYCRNPDGKSDGSWCYTTDHDDRWEYCDLPMCWPSYVLDCKLSKLGREYAGNLSQTANGLTCQRWDSHYPHSHKMKELNFPERSFTAAENYCRNPDDTSGGPWCYTTDHDVRWEFCDLPMCLSANIPGRTCRAPKKNPPNTVIMGQQPLSGEYLEDNVIEYECQLGYYLTGGDLRRTCLGSDVWSGNNPICFMVHCKEPSLPEKATYSPDTTVGVLTFSMVLSYVCQESTRLTSGDLTRECLHDGTWSGEAPVCQEISCSPLAETYGITLNVRRITYLSKAVYRCDDNFEYVSGDDVRVCQANQTWSGSAMVCKEIRCSPLLQGDGVTALVEGTAVGNEAKYECSPGYRPVSGPERAIRTCNKHGQWSGDELVCVETLCGPPPKPERPVVIVTGSNSSAYHVSDSLLVGCKKGYETVDGQLTIECKDDGSWTQVSLVCKETKCEMPEPIDGTTLDVSRISLERVALYSCPEETVQAGETVESMCLSNGMWSEVDISCDAITCGMVTPLPHSVVNITGNRIGDTAIVSCGEGYQLTSANLMTCNSSGQWEGDIAQCEQILCETPEPTAFTEVHVDGLAVGSKANLSCALGYQPINVTVVNTCSEDGTWVGDSLNCSKVTLDEFSFENSSMKHELVEFEHGVNITFACDEGYFLTPRNASGFYTFQDVLQMEPPDCLAVTCELPPLVENGTVDYDSLGFDSTATYVCDDGFLQTGSSVLQCGEQGSWIGDFPVCEREIRLCPLPDSVPHSDVSFTNLEEGAGVSYTCDKHHWMEKGDAQLTCGSGLTWIGQLPTCSKLECPRPPTLTNASWHMDTRAMPDLRAIYQCLPLFELVEGDLVKECNPNGTWEGMDPVCIESGKGWEIYIPEDPPLTKHEEMLESLGFKEVDTHASNISCGILGCLVIAFCVGTIITLDCIRVDKKRKRHKAKRGRRVAGKRYRR